MTERNDGPQAPMSRMRFSWQRQGDEPLPGDPATDPDRSPPPEPRPWEPAGYVEPGQPPPPPSSPPAMRQEVPPPPPDDWVETAPPGPSPAPPSADEPVEFAPPPHPSRAGAPRSSAEAWADSDATPPPKDRGKVRKRGRKGRGGGGDFDVPSPGGRFSGGRGSHALVRVSLILTTCLVAVAVVGYVAFAYGVSTVRNTTYRLSEADVQRYHLTDFPLEQAGQFAADYARACLAHPADEGAIAQRERQLKEMASPGVDSTCGWNGGGQQSVVDAAWTGDAEPVEPDPAEGKARQMTVRVLTSSGSRLVVVPVYVANLESGQGLRVIGDVGEMPQPALGKAPAIAAPSAVDGSLGAELLSGQFFSQFFTAWGASDRVAMQRLITPDATSRARSGMGKALTEPTVDRAQVFLPKQIKPGDEFEWKTGQVTEAWVWVTWVNPRLKVAEGAEAAKEGRAYRIQLVKTANAASSAQEWTIRDIRGGVPRTS